MKVATNRIGPIMPANEDSRRLSGAAFFGVLLMFLSRVEAEMV